MAITWGPAVYDSTNGFRIGYEFSQSPSTVSNSTTSVTVTLKIYLGTQYYAYDSGVNWSISGNISASGTTSFNHTSGTSWSSSNVTLLATRTRTVTPSFTSTVATSITASVNSLTAIAGTASVSGTWTTGKRPIIAPDAPTGNTLGTVTDAQASMSWTNNNPTDPAAPYVNIEVEKYDYAIGSWGLFSKQGVITSYTVTGLAANKKYAFRVRATNGAGASGYSGVYNVHTTPAAPSNLKATKTNATEITLSWTNNAAYADTVEIWHRTNGVRDASALMTVSSAATQQVFTGLSTTTGHSYELRAKDSVGSGLLTSAYSTASNQVTLQDTAPGAVTAVTPATSTITVPNPVLGLTMAAINTGQTQKGQWQFATDTGFTANVITITEADADLRASGATTESPTFSQLSLSNGTWYMRARAVDIGGQTGPWSATSTLTVNTPLPPTPTAVAPASGATVTTQFPTVSATIAADSVGRTTKAEWTLATNNTFTTGVRSIIEADADFAASGTHTEVADSTESILGNGTWYVRARSIAQDGSVSAWTTAQSFTLTLPAPPTPTALSPLDASTITTDFPTLSATLGAASEGRLTKAQFQVATDTGFTANLRTITESDSDYRTSGVANEQVPSGSGLFQGVWYFRARAVDPSGQYSSYTATQSFTVAHKPTAIPSSPLNDNTLPWQNTVFTWSMSDPEPTDTQSAYQIQIERNDTGASVYNTGKVTSTVKTATITTAQLLKDVKLRWKLTLWDSDNVASNASNYALFTVSDPPVITITSPTLNQQIGTGQPTITWNLDAATTQASYRVIITRVSDGVTIIDSNTVSTTTRSYTTPGTVLENNVSYTVAVTVTDTAGLASTATQPFSTSYQAPPSVDYTVDGSVYEDQGYINVDWSTTAPDGFFVQWNVYRRMVGVGEWEKIVSYTDSSVTAYHDWEATAGDVFQYAVTQQAGRSGLVLESVINPTPDSINAAGTHYWLINPYDESNNLKIDHVVEDNFTDEFDEEALIIIGRGRKVNQGTRHGYSGTLTAQLRDDPNETARSKRLRLQTIKSALTNYYLRNPFGDMYVVSLSNLSFSRVAGVGSSEFVDVTIPYMEVF